METKGFLKEICFPELGPSPAHSHSICSADKIGSLTILVSIITS